MYVILYKHPTPIYVLLKGTGMYGAANFPAGRGGAKKRVNRLIKKFDKSAQIVIDIFVVHYDVLIKKNIISFHFKQVFL